MLILSVEEGIFNSIFLVYLTNNNTTNTSTMLPSRPPSFLCHLFAGGISTGGWAGKAARRGSLDSQTTHLYAPPSRNATSNYQERTRTTSTPGAAGRGRTRTRTPSPIATYDSEEEEEAEAEGRRGGGGEGRAEVGGLPRRQQHPRRRRRYRAEDRCRQSSRQQTQAKTKKKTTTAATAARGWLHARRPSCSGRQARASSSIRATMMPELPELLLHAVPQKPLLLTTWQFNPRTSRWTKSLGGKEAVP